MDERRLKRKKDFCPQNIKISNRQWIPVKEIRDREFNGDE